MKKRRINFKVIQKRIRKAYRQMRPAQRRRLMFRIVGTILSLSVGICIGNGCGKMKAEKLAAAEIKTTESKLYKIQEQLQKANQRMKTAGMLNDDELEERLGELEGDLPWNMTFVNAHTPVEEGYVPELVEIEEGYLVDTRIKDDLKAMLDAARAAGTSPIICSAYRSEEKQIQLFDNTFTKWMDQGYNVWESYQKTSREVALPGTSEHALGLAVDIISNQYAELDEKQADTPEAKWFAEHCHEYGFILRYPPDKMEITGIIYEPWHYRYVGKEYAKKIKDSGLTLDEYLGKSY